MRSLKIQCDMMHAFVFKLLMSNLSTQSTSLMKFSCKSILHGLQALELGNSLCRFSFDGNLFQTSKVDGHLF